MRVLFVYVMLSLLTGCVAQRYIGVQITSTQPLSIARVVVNGETVVMCRVGE